MLDFLKIKVTNSNTIKYFREHPLPYFHSDREILLNDHETIKTKKTRQYDGIIFEFTKQALYISFKPHYYFNKNLHNANDFSILNCIKTLNKFTELFKVDLKYLFIIHIEFGINISLPEELIEVKELMSCLIYHGQNEFYTDRKYILCRYSSSVDRRGVANVYKIIKAYAKGIQFPLYTDNNTFRFEIKSNRKDYIKSLGIKTLKDLLDPEVYQTLSKTVLSEFDEVLIVDNTVAPKLSKTRLNNHYNRLNPITWRKYINRTKNVYRRNFNKYYEDLDTCETHLKKEIKKLIINKLDELKKCADLTVVHKQNKGAVLSIYKDKQSTLKNERKCLVTGLSLLHEKNDAIYIRTTTINYLKLHDEKKYIELCSSLLPKFYCDRPKYEGSMTSHLAKQVRNRYYSQFPIKQSGYNQKQYPNQLRLLI